MVEFKVGDLVRYHSPPSALHEQLMNSVWLVTRVNSPMNYRIEPLFGYDGPDTFRTSNSAYIEKLEALDE